jgi:hypothetical protein
MKDLLEKNARIVLGTMRHGIRAEMLFRLDDAFREDAP